MLLEDMKIPFVREWGSWAVFISSWLAALIVGMRMRPWEAGRDFLGLTVYTILGLTFLINSKNPLTSVLKTRGKNKESVLWSLFFCSVGIALLTPFLKEGIQEFWLFSLLVLSYGILLLSGKEHHIIAELNGFAMLTLSAPIVYYAVTGEVSMNLYAAVTLFFSAGVLKVKVRLKKTAFYRWIMVLYCVIAAVVYSLLNISTIILLPLIENVFSALTMREEKLKTTGNTELVKGIIFVILLGVFWQG